MPRENATVPDAKCATKMTKNRSKERICVDERYDYLIVAPGKGRECMLIFDWHRDRITRATPITKSYRNTQNVRRFFIGQCGATFKFDRDFMGWIKNGRPSLMGDAAAERRRRSRKSRQLLN